MPDVFYFWCGVFSVFSVFLVPPTISAVPVMLPLDSASGFPTFLWPLQIPDLLNVPMSCDVTCRAGRGTAPSEISVVNTPKGTGDRYSGSKTFGISAPQPNSHSSLQSSSVAFFRNKVGEHVTCKPHHRLNSTLFHSFGPILWRKSSRCCHSK